MKAEINKRGDEIILDNDTRMHIAQASKWLVGINDKPGLMLRGDVGNGKTTLMRAICLLIAYVTEEINGYSNRIEIPEWSSRKIAMLCGDEQGRKEYRKLMDCAYLAIDELGEEPREIMSYGMLYEPIKEILLERYNRQLFTIVTTNLPKDEIAKRYSKRISDRFSEMMAVINFTNSSYRINNSLAKR